MERLHYLEIQIKRTEHSIKRALRHQQANWMIKPLQDHLRRLEYEKNGIYYRMMKEKTY